MFCTSTQLKCCITLCCVADMMVGMGYSREEINDSLSKMKYDDITAAYLLLGRRAAEVRGGYHGDSGCDTYRR